MKQPRLALTINISSSLSSSSNTTSLPLVLRASSKPSTLITTTQASSRRRLTAAFGIAGSCLPHSPVGPSSMQLQGHPAHTRQPLQPRASHSWLVHSRCGRLHAPRQRQDAQQRRRWGQLLQGLEPLQSPRSVRPACCAACVGPAWGRNTTGRAACTTAAHSTGERQCARPSAYCMRERAGCKHSSKCFVRTPCQSRLVCTSQCIWMGSLYLCVRVGKQGRRGKGCGGMSCAVHLVTHADMHLVTHADMHLVTHTDMHLVTHADLHSCTIHTSTVQKGPVA